MNRIERPDAATAPKVAAAQLVALSGIPLVEQGDDLVAIFERSLLASGQRLQDGDILVIAQKIVSKAEGRAVRLDSVTPSPQAVSLAGLVNKPPQLVELILRESTEVVRARRDVLIVAHRLGFVIANAGIDQSNIDQESGAGVALLLPENPDQSCLDIRRQLGARFGADIGVIINDSHGRAFRNGTVGTAIGVSGVSALSDLRGRPDLFDRRLQSTEVGTADEIAAAASLLMGQAGEGRPVVLVRGLGHFAAGGAAEDLVRPKRIDLFRAPAGANQPVLDALRGRRSIRRYQPRPVPDHVVTDILAAAVSAPSAHNRQPWRFAILSDPGAKENLATAMAGRLKADRTRDGDSPEAIEADAARSIARITAAPVCIVVSLTMADMDRYPDPRRSDAEYRMAVQGTAMALQNLLVAAHAFGLGSSVMCAPLFCPETVVTVLELPEDWQPQALVTIGYPASAPKPFSRRKLDDVVRVIPPRP